MEFIKDHYPVGWKGYGVMEKDYTCGYCGRHTSSTEGLPLVEDTSKRNDLLIDLPKQGIYICTHCKMPSFFWENIQIPGNRFGNPVVGISIQMADLYEEARSSYSVGAYTGVVLLCRKLLMHIAVELGAEEEKRFVEYVDYLDKNHYISANSKKWVDQIRKDGNEATHQMATKTKEDAEKLIKFCEMIMKTNFEYPSMLEINEN